MIESSHDCGHACCIERQNPFHDHFLRAASCPSCKHHNDRMAEVEAAANLIAERLAAAGPAVVESVVGDRSLYLTDASGTVYLAEPEGVWSARENEEEPSDYRAGVYYEDEFRPADAVPLYRLTVQDAAADDAIARGAQLARAFNAAGRGAGAGGRGRRRPEMSEDLASSGTAGGGGVVRGAVAPSRPPFEHVWTCRLQAGDETCECEAYARS